MILPLMLGLLSLALGAFVKYVMKGGGTSFVLGIVLTIGGFIFMQAMRQLHAEEQVEKQAGNLAKEVKNRQSADAAFLPGSVGQVSVDKPLEEGKRYLSNQLAFLIVRALISLLFVLMGIATISNGELLWGISMVVLGGIFLVAHIG